MPLVLAETLAERFGTSVQLGSPLPRVGTPAEGVSLGWDALDDVLPDRVLPRGVVEVRAPRALACGTSLALAAVRAVHERDARAFCAWLDPEANLYAPGVAMAGVDLARLVVVRPPRLDLPRIAVKVARAQAFDTIVVDVDPVGGVAEPSASPRAHRPGMALEVWVRKLALLAAEGGSTVILLTDARVPRPMPLPVALRLELSRTAMAFEVRVAKERHGRVGLAKTVPLSSRPGLRLVG